MRMKLALVVAGMMVLGFGVGSAAASHSPTATDRCTYEIGGTGDFWENTMHPDPTGLTNDGTFSWGGCLWYFPDSDPGGSNVWDNIEQGRPVEGEFTQVQISVIDDVFGSDIGAAVCNDIDHNYVCGEDEKGEFSGEFCSTSPVFDSPGDADGDGHDDFGYGVAVFVNGPSRQAEVCDPVANPVGGTSGGYANPNGGIFLTFSG